MQVNIMYAICIYTHSEICQTQTFSCQLIAIQSTLMVIIFSFCLELFAHLLIFYNVYWYIMSNIQLSICDINIKNTKYNSNQIKWLLG